MPDLWLLRKSPKQASIMPGVMVPVRVWTETTPHMHPELDGLVDRIACEAIMRDDSRSKAEACQAALLSDALRMSAYDGRYLVYFHHGQGDRVCCPRTILPLQSRMADLVFLQAINVVKDPITRLLNKSINQRCMIRKYNSVAHEAFRESNEALVTMRWLLLVSLLGNYEHARASSRPDIAGRRWLYRLLEGTEPDNWTTSFHLRLYNIAPHLMPFVVREYMVYALEDDPALKAHYNTFSDAEKLKSVVVRCMDDVRAWFARNIGEESSSLHASLWTSERKTDPPYIQQKPDRAEAHFFEVLNKILCEHHESLLRMCYKRPKDSIVTLIHGLRTTIPMVKRPGYVDRTKREMDEFDIEEALDAKKGKSPDSVTTTDLRPFLAPPQLEAVSKITCGALETLRNPALALIRSLDILECCGVPHETALCTKRLIRDIQSGVINNKQYLQQLRKLQRNEPHAYNVVQSIVEIMREKQRVRVLCDLPVNYRRNQLRAIKERFGIHASDPRILKETLHFTYCPVCDSVYSLVRDFASTYVNNYGYGLRDAVVSYTTDKLYCKRTKVNHRGACERQELISINILGKLLFFQGKTIILCPQTNCGMPMVLDSKQCVWTDRGPSCYDCSFRYRMARLDHQFDFQTRCALCFQDLIRMETLFLYPHGVALCQKHHNRYPQLKTILQTPENIKKCSDRMTTIRVIHEYHKRRKAERLEANREAIKFALKRSKMNTRSRKR